MDITTLFSKIETLLHKIGVHSQMAIDVIDVSVFIMICALIGWLSWMVVSKWLAAVIIRLARRTPTVWDDLMFDKKFFNRLGLLAIPISIRVTVGVFTVPGFYMISKFLSAWIVVAFVVLIAAVLDGINRIYESYPISKNKPIKVFIQVVLIFFYCAAVLIVIGIFTDEKVSKLLAGLAAFAAVLILVFQNSILGFVAGIQLSANDMVRIGDWIVMPGAGADGDVLEINLTTVKVQNWDKTITTIPTHKLVNDSFTNWRGMFESRGRRIKRSVNIDVNTVHYLTDQELQRLKESDLLRDYITKKINELAVFNSGHGNELDIRRLTNIGTFREYMESWLRHNPNVNQEMTCMVRQLQPTPTGIPLEIYCFSARQGWIDYENVQSDIFDHVYAIMDLFGLRAFQFLGSADPELMKRT